MSSSFTEVSILGDSALTEQLVGFLSQLGFEGFWEDGSYLKCYITNERWTPDMLEEVRRIVRLVTSPSASVAPVISVQQLHDQNWNEDWEKTIKPIHVTENIIVKPTWHAVQPGSARIILTIDPKMSFGTGYHETTRLSLRLLERHVVKGSTVLDIGTGTGILAIAALKLGARSAIGVDNDTWSYDNAQENAKLNAVEQSLKITLGELNDVPEGGFDLIVANIQFNVLVPLLPEIRSRITGKGMLILSGLLTNDEQPMAESLSANGFHVEEVLRENEWIAMSAKLR